MISKFFARPFLMVAGLISSSAAFGGTWTVATGSGYPGSTVEIAVSFTGDAVSTAAELEIVFAQSQLTLPVASGSIPNANRAGSCSRSRSNVVLGLVYSNNTAPLTSATTVTCVIPFQIQATAVAGRAPLLVSYKSCGSATSAQACSVTEGWIDVLSGSGMMLMTASDPVETDTLSVRLKPEGQAPSVTDVVGFDYTRLPANAPIQALRKVPPLRARRSAGAPKGDYLARVRANPQSDDARLERTVHLDFGSREERDAALKLLQRDPSVEVAYVVVTVPESYGVDEPSVAASTRKALSQFSQTHLGTLNVQQAHNIAGGWGLVAALDTGLDPQHIELRSVDSSTNDLVLGGSYLPFFSRNVGGRGQPTNDLRETQTHPWLYAIEDACDTQDGIDDDRLTPPSAGHGTHVAGLIGANGLDSGVSGTCLRCGFAAIKRSYVACISGQRYVASDADIDAQGITFAAQSGAQVLNMSFANLETNCDAGSNNEVCKALNVAWRNDVLMVAAAGNHKDTIVWFPARDVRVASVGGTGMSGAFWDFTAEGRSCPFSGSNNECGSNRAEGYRNRQELVAPAVEIRSTIFPGQTWNTTIQCGDGFPAGESSSDGIGQCTGTSMSVPMVAGLYGLLRSINPLMRAGDPVDLAAPASPNGIREIVAQTASRAAAGLGEDLWLGFGTPNPAAAAAAILGKVRTEQMVNRVTPLFAMYSSGGNDHAAVATPQLANALALYSTNAYMSVGSTIPGYSAFPNPDAVAVTPKARAFVLTTERKPFSAGPALVPLYLLEKKRTGAVACDPATDPKCYGDFMLAGSVAQVNDALDRGYTYGGVQGYVFESCNPIDPNAACKPAGTEALHMKCHITLKDCAVFLESERLTFEAQGYTSGIPAHGAYGQGSPVILGYAYTVEDVDADGLPDALERVIGTSMSTSDSDGNGISDGSDSDGDGASDALEYPLGGAPVSDPCGGPNIICPRPAPSVFKNGFE